MSIKARLFIWLMPALVIFVGLVSYAAYVNTVDLVNHSPADIHAENVLRSIVAIAFMTLLALIIIVFVLAHKIASPVKKLKNAALNIAAGEYGESIHIQGPPEVVELANTLNTMSECLEEQIQRLRESSIAKERMYGEYECSRLLQQYMMQYVIEEAKIPKFTGRALRSSFAKQLEGVYLEINQLDSQVEFMFSETREAGFKGMLDLIKATQKPTAQSPSRIVLKFDSKQNELNIQNIGMAEPIIWNLKSGAYSNFKNSVRLNNGDFIILFNSCFSRSFADPKLLHEWFAKVLRHFGEEGLDAVATMLGNELNFLTNKHHINQDIHILCLQFME